MLATALALSGAANNSPTLIADAYAIGRHTPAISQALGDIADADPRVAAVLEKLAQVGPWGALIGALVPLAMQLAANHGVAAAAQFGSALGVVNPSVLLEEAVAEQEKFAADIAAGFTPEPGA